MTTLLQNPPSSASWQQRPQRRSPKQPPSLGNFWHLAIQTKNYAINSSMTFCVIIRLLRARQCANGLTTWKASSQHALEVLVFSFKTTTSAIFFRLLVAANLAVLVSACSSSQTHEQDSKVKH